MPIGKQDVQRQVSIEHEKLYREHCQLIDQKLGRGAGQGLPETTVTLPEVQCPGPVVDMILKAYRDIGWTVNVDREQREQTVIFRFT